MGEIFKRVVPGTPLEWTDERLTTATAGQAEIEHLHRYFLARALCRGQDVLDVASGEGYGAALLAQTARSVIGVDVSAEAVAHAAEAYRPPNLRFLEGDARQLPLDDGSVDTVVSFETIDHLFEHDQFLAEVRRVLRPGGRLIVSSPERDIDSPSGSSANPNHVRELTPAEFSALLRDTFAHVRLLGQRPMLGSVLVVASDQPVVDVPDSLYIETAEIGAVLAAANAAEALTAQLTALQARARAEKAEAEMRTKAAEDAEAARAEVAAARAEAAAACSQRDIARMAVRRAAAAAEGHWRGRMAEAIAEAQARGRAEGARIVADAKAKMSSATEQWQVERRGYESEIASLRRELQAIFNSTIWRALAPLRIAASWFPSPLRRAFRGGLMAIYWVLTPWAIPQRIRFLRQRSRR